MCGIYGQIALTKAKDACGLALQHRGPDAAGRQDLLLKSANQWVSLLHRRLSIIDLSEESNQPMTNEDGSIWIVYNGEIYNFLELKQELVAAGHQFRSNGDSEIVIHGYEEWGEKVFTRLRGMFALALWDSRSNRMLLVRDRIGKKPLFYYLDKTRLFFGSEIKSILASQEVPVEPDLESIDDYLTYLYFPPPRTAFKNIKKLPPATCLSIQVESDGTLNAQQREFWDPLASSAQPVEQSEEAWLEQMSCLVREATNIRLVSDVPLGLTLSGGLDSSTITAIVAQESGQRPETFTVGFRGSKFYNELPSANLVASHFNTNHHVLEADASCTEHLSRVVRHFDEPFGNPTAVLQYILTKLMRQHVTVALSGEGADELFGGYVRYAGAALASQYRKFPRFVTGGLGRHLAERMHDAVDGRHGYRRVREFLQSGWQSEEDMYIDWVGYFSAEEKRELYSPSLAQHVRGRDAGDFLRQRFRRGADLDPINRLGYVDLVSFLACNCLEYSDRMAMANSLEARCPFTDHKLVEFAMQMPGRMKTGWFQTKLPLRKMMNGILPEQILRNKKLGFNPPLPLWIEGELKPLIEELLSPEAVRRRGLFQPKAVETLLADHRAKRRDNALKIWGLLMLEVWFQMYVDDSQVTDGVPDAYAAAH